MNINTTATEAPSGLRNASAGFMDGSKGENGESRLAWARYNAAPMSIGDYAGVYVANPLTRERSLAGGVASAMLTSNPTIATIHATMVAEACGTGLTLSTKLPAIADALGMTEAQARKVGDQIESRWKAWANSPEECDSNALCDFHSLASAAFGGWALTGELVAAYDWKPSRHSDYYTKVALLDPRQICADKTQTMAIGAYCFQGIGFDKQARFNGLWLRRPRLGDSMQISQPVFLNAYTSWGRRKASFILEPVLPGQPRGVSPLISALSPALERQMLQENLTAAMALQSMAALTVESELPSKNAFASLSPDHIGPEHGMIDGMLEARAEWYGAEGARIKVEPGVVNHLMSGDKLKFNRFEAANSEYAEFEKALTREAARAAGLMTESVSGSYADVNFSASRMAAHLPWQITLRRRRVILERFYREALSVVLEEMVERGLVEWPSTARPFFMVARLIESSVSFQGAGAVEPDPKKAADSAILRLENHLSTLESELAQRGLDLEDTINQRAREMKMLKDAGLLGVEIYPGAATTQTVVKADDEEDILK